MPPKFFWRDMLILFALALIIRIATALPQQQPGYFDATYYYVNALNLAQGRGFVEDFIWNYLDNLPPPPQPGNLYWMPFTSMVAAAGMIIGGQNFRAAQAVFIFLSALLPLVSYVVTVSLSSSRRLAWLAGLLTVFSGFYISFWTTTDNFTLFALTGSLALFFGWLGIEGSGVRGQESGLGVQSSELGVQSSGDGNLQSPISNLQSPIRHSLFAILSGVFAGLAHLSRADGPLLLIAILLPVWFHFFRRTPSSSRLSAASTLSSPKSRITHYVLRFTFYVLLGYFLIMTPWFIRNWQVAGTPLPAAGSKTIWLTTYDDLFSYNRELSPHTFLAQGWRKILAGRWWALTTNLQTVIAVWGMVFLGPLALIGGWRMRHHLLVQMVGLYALLLFVSMTFVFAFPGARGGLFHSGAALLPFVYALAVIGLDALIDWVARRRRRWKADTAKQVFGLGLVLIAMLVSGFAYFNRVLKDNLWNSVDHHYPSVVAWVAAQNSDAIVMIGNPAAYRYYGGGLSVVVPNESLPVTLEVAQTYGARYLILDQNRPLPLVEVYLNPTAFPKQLRLAETFDPNEPVYIFEIVRE